MTGYQDDTISGFEHVKLGSGDDYIDGSGTSGNAIQNNIWGGAGEDTIFGRYGEDTLYGGSGDDTIYAGQDNDIVYGNEDNDYLAGYTGDDILYGGSGNDNLYGQDGADIFYGGAGKDYMYSGGADGYQDTFIFETASESAVGAGDDYDRIVGFEVGTDEINLTRSAEYTIYFCNASKW